jgi:hypothetical protein
VADASDLTSKALQIIGDAQGYLTVRAGSALSAAELDHVHGLHARLQESANYLVNEAAIGPDEPSLAALSQELEETHKQIRGLHEWNNFADVANVMGTLLQQVQMLAGPHGPGGGRPR